MKVNSSITVLILAVGVALMACSCRSSSLLKANERMEQNEIVLTILADMVLNADTDVKSPRFVDLLPVEIEQLQKRCGFHFKVFSISEAEVIEGKLHLKGTNIEGVHLRVEVMNIHGRKAEASGSYNRGDSVVSFHYRLRFTDGMWRIISEKNTYAT